MVIFYKLILSVFLNGDEVMKQIERIIKILEQLSMNRKVKTRDLQNLFNNAVSLRTIQRDILAIERAGIPLKQDKDFDGSYLWSFTRDYRKMILPSIQNNELMAAYILKSYLNTFKGTKIEESVNSLLEKIELIAPGEVYLDLNIDNNETIIWDQNFGDFDYQNFDRILQTVISFILKKEWVSITYRKPLGDEKTYDIFIHKLFVYAGVIYLAASTDKYDDYLVLALQRIKRIEKSENQNRKTIQFNIDEFRKNRFAVFSGKVEHVKLHIALEVAFYFTNRKWHPSQHILVNKNGSLLLEMDVPITYELVGWILGWHSYIKVVEPEALVETVKKRLKETFELYT